MKKILLREYVRQLLGEAGYDSYGYYTFGDAGKLAKDAFVKPMADFIKVFGGEALRTASNAKLASRAVFSTLKSSFVPRFEADWKKIFGENSKEIGQIKKLPFYREALSDVKDTVLGGDAGLVLFLYDPAYWLTAVSALGKAPVGLESILSSIGSFDTKLSPVSAAAAMKKNQDLLPLSVLSKRYRKEVEEFSQRSIEEMERIAKMDNSSFIKEYASSLGDKEYLAKEMLQNIESLKKSDRESVNVEKTSQELTKNLDALVDLAKESIRRTYLSSFEKQLKAYETLPGSETSEYLKHLRNTIKSLKEIKL